MARPSPPPTAAPWTAATIGFLVRNSRPASRYRCCTAWSRSSSRGRWPSWLSVEPSPKLAPAQNALPCAASTTARQLMSWSSASSAPAISWISAISKKLFGGRRISIKATWPVTSTAISVNGPMALSPGHLLGGAAARGLRLLDDQGVDDRDALALSVHDHRIEIDLGNFVGMVGGKMRQPHHQFD